MTLEELHTRTFHKFGRNTFTINEFCKSHRFTTGTGKVLLHRMVKNCQLIRTSRGKYAAISKKTNLMLQELKGKMYKLAVSIYERFPDLGLLLLYGSQVRGNADKYSDYDVLVVLPRTEDSIKIKKELEKKLKIRLHLTIYSKQAFRIFVITEPYLKFWFNEGIIFDEQDLVRELNKPTAKLGFLENIEEAKGYLSFAKQETNKDKRASHYYKALRILVLIKSALKLTYNYEEATKELDKIKPAIQKIRSNKSIEKKEVNELEKLTERALLETNKVINKLGENESDLYWKRGIYNES